ncbi:uncharacterized protein [Lolium perenne]|uniref:uncharacterized protein n=1 Tax=Lolium perenne TaxID=4522 RepID=UPI003A9906DC
MPGSNKAGGSGPYAGQHTSRAPAVPPLPPPHLSATRSNPHRTHTSHTHDSRSILDLLRPPSSPRPDRRRIRPPSPRPRPAPALHPGRLPTHPDLTTAALPNRSPTRLQSTFKPRRREILPRRRPCARFRSLVRFSVPRRLTTVSWFLGGGCSLAAAVERGDSTGVPEPRGGVRRRGHGAALRLQERLRRRGHRAFGGERDLRRALPRLLDVRADDHGKGGTFALYSLICRRVRAGLLPGGGGELAVQPREGAALRLSRVRAALERHRVLQKLLLLLALLGTCMVIGDGVLTPAVSVISAVSGLELSLDNKQHEYILLPVT